MDNVSLEIRRFQQDDKNRVNDFFDNLGPQSRGFFNLNNGNRNSALRFFEAPEPTIVRWLALDNSKMVGYVFLCDTNTSIPVLGIAVSDEYRGNRIGMKLLQTAADWVSSNSKGGIWLTTHQANIAAQVLYTRFGFKRMGNHLSGEVFYLFSFEDEPTA